MSSIVYLSTYPPTQCGLATFTRDLACAVSSWNAASAAVIAVAQGGEKEEWPEEVTFVVRRNHELDYIKAAKIASDTADVVSIQHEFGIFGGKEGAFVLTFLKHLRKPAVVTLHTVLSHPDPQKHAIIQEISRYAALLVTMNRLAIPILERVYGIPPYKVIHIPHGAPDDIPEDKEGAKRALGLSGKVVLATFGLLGPGKGIEYVIEALPEVVCHFPDVTYLIIGATHPKEREARGEAYRTFLETLVHELNLENHVHFVNRYLPCSELHVYLAATDIYLTPYCNPEQVTSGTLTYALRFGKVIISTPYLSAREVLQDSGGILVPFRNPSAIASAICELLSHPEKMEAAARKAREQSERYSWRQVGKAYAKTFEALAQDLGTLSLPGKE